MAMMANVVNSVAIGHDDARLSTDLGPSAPFKLQPRAKSKQLVGTELTLTAPVHTFASRSPSPIRGERSQQGATRHTRRPKSHSCRPQWFRRYRDRCL